MLGKIEGRKRRDQQKMRWIDDLTNSMDMSLSKLSKTNILGAERLVMQGWRPFLSKQSRSNAALLPPLES